MNATLPHGGWALDRPQATGVSSIMRMVGWMTTASAALTALGTGGELSIERFAQDIQALSHRVSPVDEVAPASTPAPRDSLTRIREVLKPAVSDLATTLGVSRQSVYNWMNGDPVADENAARLHDLAQAADVLARAGVVVDAALMKRKFAKGRTLMQLAQSGESARDAALLLVQIHRREAAQRERMNARFSNRAPLPASADFDLPAANDKT